MDNQQHRPTLLDVPISYFEYDYYRGNFANVPARVTTLRRIITTMYYRPPIEAIRAEPDTEKQVELKKQLPAVTPAALLHHRKRDTSFAERISQQWPLMMGDVDKKDNPGVDMTALKKAISRLPYVLVCAYSVRGGIWFVVRLPDHQTPDTLAAHFRYLQKVFDELFGSKTDPLVLDTSKGGNPTDLRFVSYDPEPYINDNATLLTGTYTPPPPKPRPVDYSQFRGEDAGKLLTWLVRRTEAAGEGDRHVTLRNSARLAGGFVAAGRLDDQAAVCALETVASEWPTFSKSQKTIRDGIRHGLRHPIHAEARHKQPARPERRTVERKPILPIETDSTAPISFTPAGGQSETPPTPTWNLSFPMVNRWDMAAQLARIKWCVLPPGVEELRVEPCEHIPAGWE